MSSEEKGKNSFSISSYSRGERDDSSTNTGGHTRPKRKKGGVTPSLSKKGKKNGERALRNLRSRFPRRKKSTKSDFRVQRKEGKTSVSLHLPPRGEKRKETR